MPVRYIEVTSVTNLFKPVTRSFGDIAIVGDADSDANGPKKTPIPITNPNNATYSSRTSLSIALDATATTITVTTTSGFPSGTPFNIRIDNETLKVTGVSTNTWTVTRAEAGTTAASHASGASVIYTTKDQSVDSTTWFKGSLGKSVRKAFEQEPGPTVVWAIRIDAADNTITEPNKALSNALNEVAKLDVQIVLLANTPLKSATVGGAQIELLASHVSTVSNTGGDGKERIGVAMLDKNLTDSSIISTNITIDRMTMVAHKSDEDAAAAVAGTIAGYEPHISLLLKPVKISMDELFSDSEIDTLNTARLNWLTDPVLLPGKGLFMGEGYTLGADRPYIDIVRTIDDISFRLKAALIRSIGNLRISRSGLRSLESQMTAVLEPLKQREVIEAFDIFIPLLVLLDKPPGTLPDAELQQINSAQNERVVDVIISVDYAGAIHRLNITLKFD